MSASNTCDNSNPVSRGCADHLKVWDVPTRFMHWSLVASVAVCWWTGLHDELEYHLYAGYAALWVVLMRIYWGLAGSSTARFVNFVRGPKSIIEYVRTLHRRDTPHVHGHNALGAIGVLLMLALVLAVTVLGLFSVDVDGLYSGPLSSYVSFHAGRHLAHLHYRIFKILLIVIGLHLIAVLYYYAYKRQNLVFPMITGRCKGVSGSQEQLEIAPTWRFLVGAILVSLIVWAVTKSFYF